MGNFINFSNHRSAAWSDKQLKAANEYGQVIEYPFPNVEPSISGEEVVSKAEKIVEDILKLNPEVVMCQGEFTLSFHVVRLLKENGIKAVAACSERVVREIVREDGATEKTAVFEFVKFREF